MLKGRSDGSLGELKNLHFTTVLASQGRETMRGLSELGLLKITLRGLFSEDSLS